MKDIVRIAPYVLALTGTGILGAGFLIGLVPLGHFMTWIGGLAAGGFMPTVSPRDYDESEPPPNP